MAQEKKQQQQQIFVCDADHYELQYNIFRFFQSFFSSTACALIYFFLTVMSFSLGWQFLRGTSESNQLFLFFFHHHFETYGHNLKCKLLMHEYLNNIPLWYNKNRVAHNWFTLKPIRICICIESFCRVNTSMKNMKRTRQAGSKLELR